MNRAVFLRSGYQLIVRLHPGAFRERFGDEMMWIFEEESKRGTGKRGTGARLLFDGVLSLFRQRLSTQEYPRPAFAGFGLLAAGPGIAPRRFVEAGITATLVLAGFIFLLGKAGTPFLAICPPVRLDRVPRMIQAPSRIQSLPNLHSRVNPTKVDDAAASAVRVANAVASTNGASSRFCSDH